MKRQIITLAVILCMAIFGFASGENVDTAASADMAQEERQMLTITLNDQAYIVQLEDNETVQNILEMLPLEADFTRFGGHEFYTELPETPVFDMNRTSQIQAGHLYYWDGWNAFVINYIDWDISPYHVVHLGEVTDPVILEVLAQGDDNVTMRIEKRDAESEKAPSTH